ncbi:MAG: helix-turn-helix domain-containing protein [Myxococcales bacterium]|nr:helix-turn-helix domain-containing protein [Myxococcales bacterium]
MRTLEDQERSGRAAQVPVEIRCKLVQIACERPAAQEPPAPFRDIWTYESLARSLEEQIGYRLSVSEVGRILRFEKIRPHRIRQWLKSSGPNFLPKAKRICNLVHSPTEECSRCVR